VTNIVLPSDLVFGNEHSFLEFVAQNAYEHKQWLTAALTSNITWQTFPLFDIGSEPSGWLQVHQQEHLNITTALGINGPPDLQTVDLKNEEQFYQWLLLHTAEHQKIEQALGL